MICQTAAERMQSTPRAASVQCFRSQTSALGLDGPTRDPAPSDPACRGGVAAEHDLRQCAHIMLTRSAAQPHAGRLFASDSPIFGYAPIRFCFTVPTDPAAAIAPTRFLIPGQVRRTAEFFFDEVEVVCAEAPVVGE